MLKDDYGQMIVKSYKSRSEQSRAMFLLSSENFLQAYKRAQYMKQYASYRKNQGLEIQSKSEELVVHNQTLEVQKTAKQKLIEEKRVRPMVLAMPSDGLFGDGSGYVPHKTEDYEKWIVQDVVLAVKEKNENIDDFSPVFITGLSMGGFGALRLGAKYPHLFRGFSGLSSITHFDQMALFLEDFENLKDHALEQDGVLDWMLLNKNHLSPFRFDCGREDLLIEQNRSLHQALLENDIPHIYEENKGKHEWDYWTNHIEKSILFFDALI